MRLQQNLALLLVFLFMITSFPVNAQEEDAFPVVKKYIEYLDENNWRAIPNLWVKDDGKILIDFINKQVNHEMKLGLFNIKKAKLVACKELPFEYAKTYIPIYYLDRYKSLRFFYVSVNYKVHHEDKYHINGNNYFFVVVAMEDNEWKIMLTPHVLVNTIITDGYGFGTEDEKTFDQRRMKYVVKLPWEKDVYYH